MVSLNSPQFLAVPVDPTRRERESWERSSLRIIMCNSMYIVTANVGSKQQTSLSTFLFLAEIPNKALHCIRNNGKNDIFCKQSNMRPQTEETYLG